MKNSCVIQNNVVPLHHQTRIITITITHTALDITVKSIIMSKTYFGKVVEATGKNFSIEQSISGYYRLMLDDEPYFDDSAADDVNEDYETAEAFFITLLLENEVPENRKKLLGGSWVLA